MRFTFRLAMLLLVTVSCAAAALAQTFTFTTIAGAAEWRGSTDGTGTTARFYDPLGIAVDKAGNIYVADRFNFTIRKITPAGRVTTLAGLAGVEGKGINGTGSAARFSHPYGVTVDSSGNVFVADTGYNCIRKITPTGVVTTIGTAYKPYGVAVDGSGNVYVTTASMIKKIAASGATSIFAGNSTPGYADGIGPSASFNVVMGITIDPADNLYVTDGNNCVIRKITPAGVVTTFAGLAGSCGGVDGSGATARFSSESNIAIDANGNLYVAASGSVRKITPSATVTTLAGIANQWGGADGTGSAARFWSAWGVATDSSSNVYVSDQLNQSIRKVTPTGVVTTLAGIPNGIHVPADGLGIAARFENAVGVTMDSSGNTYVADRTTIRKIAADGSVTTLAGVAGSYDRVDGTGSTARFQMATGIVMGTDGNLYVTDGSIRKVTTAGAVTTIADYTYFDFPSGIAMNSHGELIVANQFDNTIKKVTAGGVTTIAGLSHTSGSADGTGTMARFYYPTSVAVDPSDNIYVADRYNQTIRKVTPAGAVTTLAGQAGVCGDLDGSGTSAQFCGPNAIASDAAGNLFVTESYGNYSKIRKVTPSGVVTTLTGIGEGYSDGTGSAAMFCDARGIAVDRAGNLVVADTATVRRGVPAIADAATVDSSSGSVGITRQLGTSAQTATSWQWSVYRRPADSAVELSSANVRNPTFTPDVQGLFQFRLLAGSAAGARMSIVDLMVGPASPHGDCNGDGVVSAADVFYLINHLFASGPPPVGSADSNGDGSLTAADIFHLINYLFANGPAPR